MTPAIIQQLRLLSQRYRNLLVFDVSDCIDLAIKHAQAGEQFEFEMWVTAAAALLSAAGFERDCGHIEDLVEMATAMKN